MNRACLVLALIFSVCYCDNTAYDPPQQIHLAVTGDATEMAFMYRTALPTGLSQVEIAPAEDENDTKYVNGTSMTYLPSAGYFHTIVVSDLVPSTKYNYRCGNHETGWSSTFQFTTGVLAGTRDNHTFIMYGDMGIFEYSFYTVAHVTRRVDAGGIDFIYQHGDFGYGNDRDAMFYELSWNLFFDQLSLPMTTTPYMTAPGNHEANCGNDDCDFYASNFTVYNDRFRMPWKESGATCNMWFSFNYDNVHFVSVSTETDFPNAPYSYTFGDQLGWLEADLQQANADPNIDWIIATGHQPIYCSVSSKSTFFGVPKGDTRNVQQAFEDLFHDYNVDLYIDGHVHGYERTYPTYHSKVVGNYTQDEYVDPEATVYIVNGSAGNIEGFYDDWHDIIPSWSAKRYWPNPEHGYGVLEVEGANTLHWTWYANHGGVEGPDAESEFDHFSITRSSSN